MLCEVPLQLDGAPGPGSLVFDSASTYKRLQLVAKQSLLPAQLQAL